MARRDVQCYLIHGMDTKAVQAERDKVVAQIVPSELRDENLTEHIATGNRKLRLESIGWDVVTELSTLSFFPDSRRVVVIHNLADLCESGGGGRRGRKKGAAPKKNVGEKFREFLAKGLQRTPNVIVFVNHEEDYDTKVQTRSALYKTIKQVGVTIECKGKDRMFDLVDELEARNATAAIGHYRELRNHYETQRLFSRLVATTRNLLQAWTVARQRRSGLDDQEIAETLPPGRDGLLGQHSFVVQKSVRAASRFTATELTAALEELLEIGRCVYPMASDGYVRDADLAIELWILKHFSPRGVRMSLRGESNR